MGMTQKEIRRAREQERFARVMMKLVFGSFISALIYWWVRLMMIVGQSYALDLISPQFALFSAVLMTVILMLIVRSLVTILSYKFEGDE